VGASAVALGTVESDYAARGAAFATEQAALQRRADRLSQARLTAFVLAAASAIALGSGWGPKWLAVAGVALGAAGYVVAARRHARFRQRERWAGVRRAVCEQGARRVARDWNALTSATGESPPAEHAFSADLDITGHASLYRLVDVTSPGPGRQTLLSWLLGTVPSRDELLARQRAVRELQPAVEWRETLTAHAWTAGTSRRTDVERFLAWAERPAWLIARPGLMWGARLLPVLIIPTIALALLGIAWTRGLSSPPAPWLASLGQLAQQVWPFPLAAGILLSLSARGALTERLEAAMSHLSGLTAYAFMLAHVETAPFTSARLASLRTRLATGRGAARELTRLGSIVRLAESRYSPMGHAVLQALGLWDFHVVAALERWQVASGAHARDWLAALGEAESLSALGTLAYDNPDWATPDFVDGPARIEARALGHPLLPATTRVSNDVAVGPPGTFVLVTGSNMSGKSTLLRAIGTNVVLAQAGGMVCAQSMRLTPVDVWTSIRIDDSLEAGVSLFMAELRRLKRIVDAAREPDRPRPLLYLLDEILHGTNTAERRIAARRVLTYLLEAGAIGAVTTHDLTLAEDPSLDAAAQRVHFTERFERRNGAMTMTFDYRLRPGLATSANALKLLAMIGLGEETTG
jgi:energy-coupling factor transporter ATP-binding protein EcfA2